MTDLVVKVYASVQVKPKFGEPCNNCGYCCLTKVCSIGADFTGSCTPPCNLLKEVDGKFLCHLANNDVISNLIGIGKGCCAETQEEVFKRYVYEQNTT